MHLTKTPQLVIILIFSCISICLGQQYQVDVTKAKGVYAYDNENKKVFGDKLIIHYKSDTTDITSDMEYWIEDFIKLPDEVKLNIIGKLLSYEHDTSICCLKVVNRSFNGIEGCRGHPKDAVRYPIQVDALFLINRLCWPYLMELFSCTPVLYDKRLKKTISNDPQKVKIVFAEYKKWYAECAQKGSITQDFPFNRGRYGWYGGRNYEVTN